MISRRQAQDSAQVGLVVDRIDARYKLSQDKNPAERERIARELEASGDSVAAETARLMREHNLK